MDRQLSDPTLDAPADALARTAAGGPPADPASVRAMFGRYLVMDRLGRGGMGEVFTAYDPDLDRKVALKRVALEPGAPSHRQARLADEAKAMAKIRHPNVVAVFDVGQIGEEIYIAMERVEGETLREWMRRPHRVGEIVEMFEQAARGLEAAHDSGLVHRDFKPENAMIDRSGRLQVLDFGLAAWARGVAEDAGPAVGTPAYMAPEQYGGAATDARSDQFPLCVALFEALHGARPFQGDTLPTLAMAVCSGTMTELGAPRRIPRWLDRAMRRGLATDPAMRWPNMRALLDALDAGLARERRGRRSWWAVTGLVGATVVTAIAVMPSAATCADADAPVVAVWNDGIRERIGAVFVGAATPLGADAWPATEARIDGAADALRSAYRASCESGASGSTPQIEQADRQRVCLHGQTQALGATLEVLAVADAAVIEDAREIVEVLPDPSTCAAVAVAAPSALDDAARGRVRRSAAIAEALLRAGKAADAGDAVAEVLAEPDIADDPAAVAELAALEARSLLLRGAMDKAAAALDRAYLAARQIDDRTRMLAVARAHVAYHSERRESAAAQQWIERARVEARVLGDAKSLAMLDDDAALQLSRLGRYEDAIVASESTQAQLAALGLADTPEAVRALSNLGTYHYSLRRFARAKEIKLEALRRSDALVGPGHPQHAKLVADLGVIADTEGDDQALAYLEEALALFEHLYDEPHQSIGETLSSLASASLRRKDRTGALAYSERALANLVPTLGPDSVVVALVYNNQAHALEQAGRHTEAVASLRSAVAIKQRVLPPDHPELAISYANLAELAAPDGDAAAVEADFRRALAIRERRDAPDQLASTQARFAVWLAETDRIDEARSLAEHAFAEPSAAPMTRVNAHYVFALLATGDTRREHATAALAIPEVEESQRLAKIRELAK